jgi:uncharacterized Zn finger protein
MKIKEITEQYRRDFKAILECESCGHEETLSSGYDSKHYHEQVLPSFACLKCGEVAPDTYRPLATKYPEGFQI